MDFQSMTNKLGLLPLCAGFNFSFITISISSYEFDICWCRRRKYSLRFVSYNIIQERARHSQLSLRRRNPSKANEKEKRKQKVENKGSKYVLRSPNPKPPTTATHSYELKLDYLNCGASLALFTANDQLFSSDPYTTRATTVYARF